MLKFSEYLNSEIDYTNYINFEYMCKEDGIMLETWHKWGDMNHCLHLDIDIMDGKCRWCWGVVYEEIREELGIGDEDEWTTATLLDEFFEAWVHKDYETTCKVLEEAFPEMYKKVGKPYKIKYANIHNGF